VTDLAVAVALGGDAACDIGVLRAHPGVFGRVASDPTVSRLIAALAADADQAVAAICTARAAARERRPISFDTGFASIFCSWSQPHQTPVATPLDTSSCHKPCHGRS
jgi:hypothetical protein